MRKKDILGHFVQNPEVRYTYAIRKLDGETEGYSALIRFLPGCRELVVEDGGERIQLSGDGYKWLMYLPMNEYFCLNAFYDPQGKILEWYFDISKGNFVDEAGMPCIDDIFLDLVILPDGRAVTLDADELQKALDKGEITADDCDHAYNVRDQILHSEWNDVVLLTRLSNALLAECD